MPLIIVLLSGSVGRRLFSRRCARLQNASLNPTTSTDTSTLNRTIPWKRQQGHKVFWRVTNQARQGVSCSNFASSPYYNICLLAMAWALTLTTLLTTLGPHSATHLDASNALAAFTIGAFLIGAAVSSDPVVGFSESMDSSWSSYWVASFNWLDMSCYDRLCCLRRTCPCSTVVASLLDLVKVSERFIVSALLRSRLARDHKSRAVTYVLSGGFFAAFLGPIIANRGKNLFETDYLGSFVIIAFFWSSSPSRQRHMKKRQTSRDLSKDSEKSIASVVSSSSQNICSTYEIVTQPLFIISCTVATLAHTIMVMIMSNVSICMADNGFSFEQSALVMEIDTFYYFPATTKYFSTKNTYFTFNFRCFNI